MILLRKRNMKDANFTIVEMLLVITVFLVLVALLLPVLSRAKQKAVRTQCLSNFRQCFTASVLFAKDRNLMMQRAPSNPNAELDAYRYRKNSILNLRAYIGSFDVWSCPNVDQPERIDDRANDFRRNSDLRSNVQYFPGNISTRSYRISPNMKDQNSDDIIISDIVYTWAGRYVTNHSKGGKYFKPYRSWNPSLVSYHRGIPYGMNAIYADGHGGWMDNEDLTLEPNRRHYPRFKYYIPRID